MNLTSAADCTACPAGKTCSQAGLTATDGDCDPGYYCSGGSWTPQPDDSNAIEALVGGLCPLGSYCPSGSASPEKCPAGTYNSFPGMRLATDCISCTPGYYCDGTGNNPLPTGLCQAGYYCPEGSSSPTQTAAQPGYYSLEGSATQIKCEPGYFSSGTASATCTSCTAGKYCHSLAMAAGSDCPAGNYCPVGTINPSPCPIGTFNPNAATSNSNACQDCSTGKYCSSEGLTAVSGTCDPGYFCKAASPSKTPVMNLTIVANAAYIDYYGICPRGNYCPAGTSIP